MKYRLDKRILKCICITFAICIFLLSAAYTGLAEYYKDGFCYGTWINGIYCTGKTVEQIEEELLKHCTYSGLTVYPGSSGDECYYRIDGEDIGLTFDFSEALKSCLDRQNPYLWIANLFHAREHNLMPVVFYDQEKLNGILEDMPLLSSAEKEKERSVYIQKTQEGYVLVNERMDVLNQERAKEEIGKALLSLKEELRLEKKGCYENLPLTDSMKQEMDTFERIEEFQSCGIIYQLGEEQVPVDASVVCDWIALEEDGSFVYDEGGRLVADDAKIEEFVDALADDYDTLGKTRWFKATRGGQVKIEGGTYGNKLDRKAEKKYLKEAFRNKESGIHIPEYIHKAFAQGKNDIGRTYIEIDMTEQKMYYYKEGRLEVETAVVTGNTGRRMGTPEGVNFVYGKQENRILRGPGYASHVNYWMPVKGNIGIHDAAWRDDFGGEIYKTNGSHGCINTPYDEMSRIYEMAEVGTPVVMFY